MIIKYSATNYRSFGKKIDFDFSSAKDRQHPKHAETIKRDQKVNKFNVIFGPNGSGKSTFVDSLRLFQRMSLFEPQEGLGRLAFRFSSKEQKKNPMVFSVSFSKPNTSVVYNYEIHYSCALSAFEYEKFSYGNRILYESINGKICEKRWLKKPEERKRIDDLIKQYARKKGKITFLSFYTSKTEKGWLSNEKPKDEFSLSIEPLVWFFMNLTIISPEPFFARFYESLDKKDLQRQNDEALQAFGLGISSFGLDSISEADIKARGAFKEKEFDQAKKEWAKVLKKRKRIYIGYGFDDSFLARIGDDGNLLFEEPALHYKNSNETLNMDEESSGTRKLINLLPVVFSKNKSAIIIDEIDRNFHAGLTIALTRHIKEVGEEVPGFQIIFTTHELQLFSLKEFRADEIFLMEKDPDNHCSSVKRLNDSSHGTLRYDRDVLSAYINNQFGGIPDIKSLKLNNRKTYTTSKKEE